MIRRRILYVVASLLAFAALAAVLRGQVTPPDLEGFVPISKDRVGVPTWENKPLPEDVFTFRRIRYHSDRSPTRWTTDYPDSDLNLSLRLQELTSMRVNPDPVQLTWQDPKLFEYPFAYVVEPGFMNESAASHAAMREFCMRGGFLMFDDFWGDHQWQNLEQQLKVAFPEYPIVELELEHPIFHSVFDLKEKAQVFTPGGARDPQGMIATFGPVHYRAIFDENKRMMVICCHNTDLGDGWEREGIDVTYFHEYAEKRAYPMAINIFFYAMTH